MAGCGGGSGTDTSGGNGANDAALSGTLIDSPVAGIGYRTATRTGTTDANGRYHYRPGETVTFFVGNVSLPPVRATGTVTPYDIADSTDPEDPLAINIACFLQSLDADADPANGITIPAGAAALATDGIDFNKPSSLFMNNQSLIALVRDANPGARTPVDPQQAYAHLLESIGRISDADRRNLRPVAGVTISQAAAPVGTQVSLSGQTSIDPNGDALTYRWTLTEKPVGSQAGLPATALPGFVFSPDVAGLYGFSLVVSDGSLDSRAASVSLSATPVIPAAITGLSISTAPAKVAIGGQAALIAMATYADSSTADVSALASWTSSAPGVVAVNAQTGAVTGMAAGSAQIAASLAGVTADAVQIEAVPLTAPSVHPPVSGPGSVAIAWEPVANAQSYVLYWREEPHAEDSEPNRVDNAQPGLQTGLAGGKTYTYRVAAVLGSTERLSPEVFAYVYGNGEPSGSFGSQLATPTVSNGANPVLLADGRVLLVGHQISATRPADLVDPATHTITQVPSPGGRLYSYAAAAVLDDGKVFYTGGRDMDLAQVTSDETFLYDPQTQSFSSGPRLPVSLLIHTATTLLDGRVLIAGGQSSDIAADWSNHTYLYDPDTQIFADGPALGVARALHGAHRLSDGRVLLFGGMGNAGMLTSAEIFDPATNTVTPAGAMVVANGPASSVLLADGRVLLAGAAIGTDPAAGTIQVFDPQTAAFTQIGTLGTLRVDPVLALLPDGKVLVAGGADMNGDTIYSSEIIDPASGQSVASGAPHIDLSHNRFGPKATPLRDGRILLITNDRIELYGP
ncbi:MAG: kelch repeat-containing protein [Burkholderiaceae bacterium]